MPDLHGILKEIPVEYQVLFNVTSPTLFWVEANNINIAEPGSFDTRTPVEDLSMPGDDRQSIVILPSISMGHMMVDFITQLFLWFNRYPEHRFIVPTSGHQKHLEFQEISSERATLWDSDMVEFCVAHLRSLGADVTETSSPLIKLDNALVMNPYTLFKSPELFKWANSALLSFMQDEPEDKIYISRAKTRPRVFPESDLINNQLIHDDERVSQEYILEKTFRDLGFKIIYLEEIESFEEQLSIMIKAKVIAGVSGAGLSNQLFMKPGGIVIEIATPIYAYVTEGYLASAMHNLYKDMAGFLDHRYISIPAISSRHAKIIANKHLDENLKNYLKSI